MAKHFKEKENKIKKEKTKNNNPKKINILLILVRFAFIIAIVISVYKLVKWMSDNKSNDELTEHLSKYITTEPDNNNAVSINYSQLKSENNNFYAWLIVNGTKINYPVVHYTDNNYYLTHSFDNSNNKAGCPFVDYRAKCDGTDKNLVIHAHNRKNRHYVFYTIKCIK